MSIVPPERGARVEFRDIGVRFGTVEALDQFNLEVKAGEFLTLLGPSGSGKTTALNMVAGFADPTNGDILIGDRSINSLPTEKRNVGMVFQNYSLFPHMSVAENVAFPLRMRRASRDVIESRVAHALQLVQLADYGSRMPHELSGGQRQRVAFARAVVFEPKVLLMDEPLGALDLKLREHMQLEIKHYQQQIGCTVIYVTHDQSEALTLSDRIVIMNRGRIVQIGTPKEVYDFPRTRFAAEFIGETNILTIQPEGGETAGWRISELGLTTTAISRSTPKTSSLLSVRPEKISRLSDGEAVNNDRLVFEAVVQEVVFLGDVIRYVARSWSGAALTFKEARTRSVPSVRVNETIQLGFSADDAVVIPTDR